MAQNDNSAKFFDGINEAYDAFIDGVRAANDRGHRLSLALIESAEQGQRDAIELARKWAAAPLDLVGFSRSVVEATRSTVNRQAEIGRQWLKETTDAQREGREAFQRALNANRSVARSIFAIVRAVPSPSGKADRTARQPEPAPLADSTREKGTSRRTARPSAPDSATGPSAA